MVSVGAHLRLISKIAGCEGKISRKEITDEGENAINYLNDLLSSCDVDCVEGKAMLCRIKRGIQELQHEFDKSENIEKSVNLQKLDALRLENERTDDSPCDDLRDSRSRPTSEVALEISLFPENDNHTVGTDAVDSASTDNARVNRLVQKFSFSDGQNEVQLPRNERKECEAEGQSVSSIIRKFEKNTSRSIPILSFYEKKSVQFARAPYFAKKVPVVPVQDKKQDTFDVTTSSSSKEEKSNKEKACSNPYLSTAANSKSMQFVRAPYFAKKVPAVPAQDKKQDTTSALSKEEKGNKEKDCSNSYLSTSDKRKSMEFGSYVVKRRDTFTTPTQEKGKMEKESSKPYLSASGNRKSMQFPVYVVKKQVAFTTPTQEKGKMEKESSKPYLYAKSMQFPPSAINWVPTVPSQNKKQVYTTPSKEKAKKNSKFKAEDRPDAATQDKKQDTFASITTLYNEMPKKGNPEFQGKDEDEGDNHAGTKYVSRLVRRFEELAISAK